MTTDDAPPYQPRVADLPASDRPRERLLERGAHALTTSELLAILLRTGTTRDSVLTIASRLIGEQQGLRGLAALTPSELVDQHGLGSAKASTILAAFELGRRLAAEDDVPRPQVTRPEHIASIVSAELELLQQEELRLLVLDTKHRLMSHTMLYRGSLDSAPARVAEVFKEAVRRNAAAIAVAHNHPSGDPTPSPEDIRFTEHIVEAGKLMNVDVLDHLVIGRARWVSLRERGLGFE